MNSKIIISILLVLSNSLFSQISQNMKKLAERDELLGTFYNDVWGYTAPNGNEYAIIGSRRSVGFYDVTDCSNPELVFEYVDGLDDNNIWRDFKTYQNVAYGSADTGAEGLEIFNLADINNITVTQNTSHFIKAHNLYVDTANARLYVAGAQDETFAYNNWMIIYDISSPLNPVLLKKIRLNTIGGLSGYENLYMHDVFVEDNIAYVSQGYAGFFVWDCTDTENITYLGHLDDGSQYNHSNWKHPHFTGDTSYFYVAEELPAGAPIKVLRVINNGSTASVTLRKRFKDPLDAPTHTNVRPHNPFVNDNGLYISYYLDGIQVYDVTTPEKPYRAAYYDTYIDNNGDGYAMDNGFNGAWGVYPFLSSGCILAADITYGLVTLKLNFPKVKINDNIYLTQPGAGIVFRDSSNTYRKLSINSNGELISSLVSGTAHDYKVDSADLEIMQVDKYIFLTGTNGLTYRLILSETGNLNPREEPVPLTDIVIFSGNILINDKHKSLILRSSATNRWKVGVKNNGSLTTFRTSF